MLKGAHTKTEARAARSRGFPVSSRRAVIWMCLSLCLALVQPSPAYAQPFNPKDQTAVRPLSQGFRVSTMHTFPLKVRVSTAVDPYRLPTDFGEGLGTLRWEVSGEGKLWDKDPGTLQLRFGTFSNLDDRDNFIEYSQPDFRITLGGQRFSLSPLVRGDMGFGLDAQGTLPLASKLDLDTRVLAYTGSEGERFGLRVSAVPSSETEASINVLTDPNGADTLLSGQLSLLPKIEELETLDLEAEYGLQLSAAPTRHAFDLSADLAKGPHSATLSYQEIDAGYNGAPQHTLKLAVDGKLQLNDGPEVNASVRLRQEVQHEATQSLSKKPGRYTLQVGGTLSGDVEGVDLSFKYDNFNSVGDAQGTSHQSNNANFSVGVPLAEGYYLYQDLEWQRDLEEGLLYEALSYSVEADLPVFGGNVRPQAALGYDLRASTFDAFNLGADYFGLITDTANLFAGSGLYLSDGTFFYLIVGGFYEFEDGQALNFNASVFLSSDFEPLIEIGLGYSLPVEVPLGPLRSVFERHVQEASSTPSSSH